MSPKAAAERIAELEGMVAALESTIVELRKHIEVLQKALAASEARNAKREAELEVLIEKLKQNSRNSHKPPSSDGPGAAKRNGRTGKKKSGRKRGGQKGHPGAHRQMFAPGEVDIVVDLFPKRCSGCASALPERPDTKARRHQMVDFDCGRRVVTEWRRHAVRCSRCGAHTRAEYDASVIPASPFGPHLRAPMMLLTGVYHLSRRQTARLLGEVFGIPISLGSVSNNEARATPALEAATEEATREVDEAAVKHADATAWLCAGVTKSLWVFASKAATVFRIFENEKRETIRPLFGKLLGVLVSDRASMFSFWAMPRRQVCWAHLLRKFVAFSQRAGPAGAIGRELLQCTKAIFEYWHGFVAGEITRDELQSLTQPVRTHIEEVLERAVAAGIPRLSGSCANMLAHRDALWTYLTHEGVEPTNNHAEQQVRGFVLWRKRSYGCQSERGLRFAERIMTVVYTARKQGVGVLDFLVRTVTAHQHGEAPPTLFAGDAAAA